MVRFIACDLDGTLVNDKKELPGELHKVVECLREKGVVFAPASGRQYYRVRAQFEPISRHFMYIAENGAYVVKDGRVLVKECLDRDTARDVLRRTMHLKDVCPMLCCEDCAYMQRRGSLSIDEVTVYYKRLEAVDNLLDYCDTKDILKVAVYSRNDAYTDIYKKLPEYTGRAQVILSGRNWVDVMKNGVSKGSAIRRIQQVCGYKKDECMCFGDYLNDYEMMFECGESFAMENAHEDLKRAAKHIAPSNNDNGVMRVIAEWFDL